MIEQETAPELIPPHRFMALLTHNSMVRQVVGERFAIFVLEVNLNDPPTLSEFVGKHCDEVIARRLLSAAPSDALVTRLRPGAYAILAFGVATEARALALSATLHHRIRARIEVGTEVLWLNASVGIAITGTALRPQQAMRAAENAAQRVRLNGGDATFFARPFAGYSELVPA